MTVQAEYRARSFGAAAVAPVEVIVTPAPAAKVVKPTPIDWTSNDCPALNTDGGIVTVTALAFDVVTSLLASLKTNV